MDALFKYVLICCLFALPSMTVCSSVQIVASSRGQCDVHTESLSVNCSFTRQAALNFDVISSLLLAKSTLHVDSDFTDIAAITASRPDVVNAMHDLGAKIEGELSQDPLGISYISYEWCSPPTTAQGRYQCLALGLDRLGHPVQETAAATVFVDNTAKASLDMVIKKITSLENFQDVLLGELNSTKEHLSVATSQITTMTHRSNSTYEELERLKSQLNTTIAESEKTRNSLELELLRANALLNSTTLDLQKTKDILKTSEKVVNSTTEQLFAVKNDLEDLKHNSTDCSKDMNSMCKASNKYIAAFDSYIASSIMASQQTSQGHTFLLSWGYPLDVDKFQMICGLHGGYLAELNDNGEYREAVDFIHYSKHMVIIGGTDRGSQGFWRYPHSGNPMDFTMWAPRYPRNSDAYNCVMLSTDREMVYMYDSACVSSELYMFLCEIPADICIW